MRNIKSTCIITLYKPSLQTSNKTIIKLHYKALTIKLCTLTRTLYATAGQINHTTSLLHAMLSSDKKNNRQLLPGLKANTWNLGQGICLLMRCLITRLYWDFWRSRVSHVSVTCSDFYLSRESRTAYIYTGYVVLIICTQIIVEGSIWHVVVCLSVWPTRSNTGSTRSRLYTGANGTVEQQNKTVRIVDQCDWQT